MRRSVIDRLPPEQRAALEREIVAHGFADYRALESWLHDTYGIELSHVSIWAHGEKLRRKLEKVRASTEAARQIAEAAPDDEDLRSGAVISMLQSEVFDILLKMQEIEETEDPEARLKALGMAAKGIAPLLRSSIAQKRWRQEVAVKAQSAADAAERIAKRGGLSAESVNELRAQILGIAA